MSILLKDLPKEDLPRERLIKYGVASLSNEELLSIIFRTGTKGEPVSTLSQKVLSEFPNIHGLKEASINRLKKIKGLGNVKIVTLLAALELGKRVYEKDIIKEKLKIRNSVDVFTYFSKYIVHSKQENFLAIYLDACKQYLNHKIIFKGTLDSSLVHPREVFREAILESAQAIIIMHNHPSGKVAPSRADDEVTRNLVEVGSIMGIQVLDHVIVSECSYYSYVEEGRLKYE